MLNMTVYVVIREWQDSGGNQHSSVVKVFDTKEKAETFVKAHRPSRVESFYAEEHEVE